MDGGGGCNRSEWRIYSTTNSRLLHQPGLRAHAVFVSALPAATQDNAVDLKAGDAARQHAFMPFHLTCAYLPLKLLQNYPGISFAVASRYYPLVP